jgi:hypothetical protein
MMDPNDYLDAALQMLAAELAAESNTGISENASIFER